MAGAMEYFRLADKLSNWPEVGPCQPVYDCEQAEKYPSCGRSASGGY